jgi:hypothetical protein
MALFNRVLSPIADLSDLMCLSYKHRVTPCGGRLDSHEPATIPQFVSSCSHVDTRQRVHFPRSNGTELSLLRTTSLIRGLRICYCWDSNPGYCAVPGQNPKLVGLSSSGGRKPQSRAFCVFVLDATYGSGAADHVCVQYIRPNCSQAIRWRVSTTLPRTLQTRCQQAQEQHTRCFVWNTIRGSTLLHLRREDPSPCVGLVCDPPWSRYKAMCADCVFNVMVFKAFQAVTLLRPLPQLALCPFT